MGAPLPCIRNSQERKWSQNVTGVMNFFRGYFRGSSADYSSHFGDACTLDPQGELHTFTG